MSHIRIPGCLLLIVVLAAVPPAVRADVLYSNPADPSTNYDAFVSQNDGTNAGWQYSSYTLSQDSLVTGVSWQGLYVSENLPDNPPPPDATSFTLSLYASVGGLPGGFLGSETIAVGAGGVQETFVENAPFYFNFQPPETTAAIYDYSVTLPTPFELPGGIQYFGSIVANTTNPVGYPVWAWFSGGDNGPTYASYQDGPTSELSRAFTLYGSVVPEPSSFVMLLFGATTLPFLRKRVSKSNR
jgi:hypothetical protein